MKGREAVTTSLQELPPLLELLVRCVVDILVALEVMLAVPYERAVPVGERSVVTAKDSRVAHETQAVGEATLGEVLLGDDHLWQQLLHRLDSKPLPGLGAAAREETEAQHKAAA